MLLVGEEFAYVAFLAFASQRLRAAVSGVDIDLDADTQPGGSASFVEYSILIHLGQSLDANKE